ncbi:MAG TPA: haloalkane dehalogenase [Gammaproteobacteria bacterium]|nr:haloalkane dehalogenase [Gammaproteobacteria bacterium]
MNKTNISSDFPYKSHYVDIYGSKMHYIQEGEGDPILFLHGIPASSYVWRNVIPHLVTLGCCIAPDLIGFGKSDKPDIQYSITDHIRYIEKFIETLKLDHILIVMHGWGSIIGFDFAMRHPEKCRGLVFYEAYLRPKHSDDISLPYQEQILAWQKQNNISDLIMNGTHFIDKVLPQSVMRRLSETELTCYREPFKNKGSGKPLYQYLHELPDANEKNNINKIVADYSKKLTKSSLPKLMLYSIPGFLTTIATLIWAKDNFPNLEIIEVGEELHYAQESNPDLMGEAISVWVQGVEQNEKII